MSYRVIVADNQDLFRVGAARLLGIEDDFHIVGQCSDPARLLKAAETFAGATIFCATSIATEWTRVKTALEALSAKTVIVLENRDKPEAYIKRCFEGILYRNVSPSELIACVRTVSAGGRHHQPHPTGSQSFAQTDPLGERARRRLTRKELQIVTLLVQGYKNRDIAEELGNTEQVIKNYMRSIFDKTGVTDRLELALFTIHHRVLLGANDPGSTSSPEALGNFPHAAQVEAAGELVAC